MAYTGRIVAVLLAATLLACSPHIEVNSQSDPSLRAHEPYMVLSWGMKTWGHIDTTGAWVVRPQFETAFRWTEGFSAVSRAPHVWFVSTKPKWGFLAPSDAYLIEPRFDDARSFHNGFAAVQLDRK